MKNVMTIEEAAKAWGVALEEAETAKYPRPDFKYSGGRLLVTAKGMNTVWGLKHKIPATVKLRDVYTLDEAQEIAGVHEFVNAWPSGDTYLVLRSDMEQVMDPVCGVVTFTEAVKKWGISSRTLLNVVKEGKVVTRKSGTTTLITAESLNQYLHKFIPIKDQYSLSDVFTLSEAAKLWEDKISRYNLDKFLEKRPSGCWQSGDIRLITRAVMEEAVAAGYPQRKKVHRNKTPVPTTKQEIDVYTLNEAAKKYGVSYDVLLGMLPKFKEHELRRALKSWLVTRSGMERVFRNKNVKQQFPLQDVFLLGEAAERWNISRRSIERTKFGPGEERSSGRVRIITRAGMERVFGNEKEIQSTNNQ